ncbi:MAG: efflux RND transporter periplasmic adaptor subunit [Planctomycetaceae bacterium]|nr:efflux RND transporter periplasmic adaptor subunit [Planctomycetaceae bacterium]
MARLLISLAVVSVVVAGVLWSRLSPGVPIDVAVASTGKISTWVEERARTRLPEVHRVTMPLAGRVKPIRLREGDRVKFDQVVAEMDFADLDADLQESEKALSQQERLVESMVSLVQSSAATIEAREAKRDYVTKELERRTGPTASRAFSDSEKDAARLAKIETDIDLTKDRLQVKMYEAMRAYTNLGLEDAAVKRERRERDRKRAEIKSPIDGIVLKRHESSERFRPAGEVLLDLGRMEDLEVEAEILTQDAIQIHEGDDVLIEGVAADRPPLKGVVHRIDPQGFTKISSLGVEQQRVLVIIRFDSRDLTELKVAGRNLGVDYRVRVRVFTESRDGVTKVSRAALFRGPDGGWQCFAVREGKLVLTPLELGLINDFEAEVKSGLAAGDQVVIAPESSLTAGIRVAPRVVESERHD